MIETSFLSPTRSCRSSPSVAHKEYRGARSVGLSILTVMFLMNYLMVLYEPGCSS